MLGSQRGIEHHLKQEGRQLVAYEDELPTKLRMERARVKKTQAQVASETGLTAAMISQYENGNKTPTLQTLSILADFYNTSITELVGK